MNELIELSRQILRKKITTLDGRLNVGLTNLLLDIQTSVNLVSIVSKYDELWAKVAQAGPEAVAVILDAAVEFRFRSSLNLINWNQFIEQLALACSSSSGAHNSKVGPVEIYRSNLDSSKAKDIFNEQPWLTVLILFVMSDPLLDSQEIITYSGSGKE